MSSFSDELRLAFIVLLNGGVFAAAYRLARRTGTAGVVQAICDAFLLYFLVQYAAVALPGLVGVFGTTTMAGVAITAAAVMWAAGWRCAADPATPLPSPGTPGEGKGEGLNSERRKGRRRKSGPSPTLEYRPLEDRSWTADRLGLLGCTLFALAYLATNAYLQSPAPPSATDALVYHLPTAIQWIQTHRLGIYPTWYWNPAASYSPATGSTFMAWWMVPAGNDVFVRYVQLPPLVFLFFLVVQLCRLVGCSCTVSGLFAIAAVLSRPLFSEAVIPKDDIYVTSFIIAAILSLSQRPIRDRHGPWRVGIALGFVLASKYTALLACPVFLFMVDSPLRARWRLRHWAIAVGIATAMAAPWYLRNILLTGNPLYPVDVHLAGIHLRGLFGTEHDQQLRTTAGVRKMLTATYHSLPIPLFVLLCSGWLAAWSAGPALLRDPLARAATIGSAATLALFLAASPHHEVRYVFPLIVLWFVACAIGMKRVLPRPSIRIAAAALFAVASAVTTFGANVQGVLGLVSAISLQLLTWGLLVAAGGIGAVWSQVRFHLLKRRHLAALAGAGGLAIAASVYIFWHAYVGAYRDDRFVSWAGPYPFHAALWRWVDENVPADATLAYANTYFVYPYYGFDFTRRVVYAPVRKGLHDFPHVPPLGDRVPGDLIVRRMTEVMDEDPDLSTWLENLSALNAGYLVVMRRDPANEDLDRDPPELRLADSKPRIFIPIFRDDAGVVYRVAAR